MSGRSQSRKKGGKKRERVNEPKISPVKSLVFHQHRPTSRQLEEQKRLYASLHALAPPLLPPPRRPAAAKTLVMSPPPHPPAAPKRLGSASPPVSPKIIEVRCVSPRRKSAKLDPRAWSLDDIIVDRKISPSAPLEKMEQIGDKVPEVKKQCFFDYKKNPPLPLTPPQTPPPPAPSTPSPNKSSYSISERRTSRFSYLELDSEDDD